MPKMDSEEQITGPVQGDFISPPEVEERDERADALPEQAIVVTSAMVAIAKRWLRVILC